ncbi:hypothetical protein AB205_0180060 [Aquarana catesbeiana]|uniref:Retinol dehydrogenase 16 n=1 Tax=Aquarana catesbeiana TaxID=8400 RepID=A0A2G9S156_AQUCT|nr:hypothetical protein AB205_0180060 [Aquarana catesbeiana]
MWLPLLLVMALILLYRWYRQSWLLENLTDKYVFITGCDTGFGNLLAKQLDKHGMRVLAACLTETGSEKLKKETSSRLQTTILDVANTQSVNSAALWVEENVRNKGAKPKGDFLLKYHTTTPSKAPGLVVAVWHRSLKWVMGTRE